MQLRAPAIAGSDLGPQQTSGVSHEGRWWSWCCWPIEPPCPCRRRADPTAAPELTYRGTSLLIWRYSGAGMGSETAVRKRFTGALAIECDHQVSVPAGQS